MLAESYTVIKSISDALGVEATVMIYTTLNHRHEVHALTSAIIILLCMYSMYISFILNIMWYHCNISISNMFVAAANFNSLHITIANFSSLCQFHFCYNFHKNKPILEIKRTGKLHIWFYLICMFNYGFIASQPYAQPILSHHVRNSTYFIDLTSDFGMEYFPADVLYAAHFLTMPTEL